MKSLDGSTGAEGPDGGAGGRPRAAGAGVPGPRVEGAGFSGDRGAGGSGGGAGRGGFGAPSSDADDGVGRTPGEQQLHDALQALVAPLTPSAEVVAGVLSRARGARRRRRAARGVASAMALAAVAVGGPVAYDRLPAFHGGARAAAPPAAVVDIATAYPLPEAPMMKDATGDADRPANALTWPARGVPLTSQVLVLAQEYLLEQDRAAGEEPTSAKVDQLWAQSVPYKTPGARKPVQAPAASTFFVLQGWTLAASGASRAVLLAGEYAPQIPRVVMYEAPLSFLHPGPNEGPAPDDVADVSELSVWSPDTNQLVVLGAPQVTKVLYAADGKKLLEEPTADGIAVFPRVKPKARQGYVDTIQVRDAQNLALTPPGAWTAADLVLGGDVAVYQGGGWQLVRVGNRPSPAPSATVWPVRPTASPTDAGTATGTAGGAPGPSGSPTGGSGVRVSVGAGASVGVTLGADGADGAGGVIGPVGPVAVTVVTAAPAPSAPTG